MARANNSPTNWSEKLLPADKSEILMVFNTFRRMPPVHKDEIEEIKKRLDDYFGICAENGIIPTVEAMGLIFGISRQTIWKWQKSDCEAGRIVERAKEVINAMIATATINGKVNPVYSIWLQKNHFGYSDIQTLQLDDITERKIITADQLPRIAPPEKTSQINQDNLESM